MQGDRILKAAIYLSRLRDSGSRDHVYRLRVASKLIEILNSFIADEVRAATNENPSDPAYVSWQGVGDVLGISKSAAYARYGKK